MVKYNYTQADIDRFMSYVEKLPNGCWFWNGARSRGGGRNGKWYGSFRVDGRIVRAHRFACDTMGAGACPEGSHRDHLCCFSLCVNPAHLEIVPQEENQRRRIEGHSEYPFVNANDLSALLKAVGRLVRKEMENQNEQTIGNNKADGGRLGQCSQRSIHDDRDHGVDVRACNNQGH